MKVFGLANFFSGRFKSISDEVVHLSRSLAARRFRFSSILGVIGALGYYGSYAFIISKALDGTLSIGTLTFLAGAEIDPRIVRKHFWSSMTIGVMGFVSPYLGVLAYAHWGIGWQWPQAQIAGIALSTTSVAVVYAVMIETGFNRTEIGKIILAACFINDLGTVLALGIVFAHYDLWLLLFGAATAAVLIILMRHAPWMFKHL